MVVVVVVVAVVVVEVDVEVVDMVKDLVTVTGVAAALCSI